MPRSNDLERDALQLVLEAGEKGILQSDMWKNLNATSREGSRLAKKFVDKGAVERKKVLHAPDRIKVGKNARRRQKKRKGAGRHNLCSSRSLNQGPE